MRLRTLAVPVMAVMTTLSVLAGTAHAETIDPIGVGGLFPAAPVPRDGGTMYETYPGLLTWSLDTDYGQWDFLDPALHMIADILMVILATLGAAVATLASWAFSLTNMPDIQGPLTQAISGSAGAVLVGLFPSALAVGALVAFLRAQRGDGGGFSDLAWVLVSAVAAATLLQTPQVWVDGVDEGRTIGTEVAMTATEAGIGSAGGGIEKMPFRLGHTTTYPGDADDRVVRRATDTVWRVYVGVPWCLAEFGSMKACQKYGKAVLDLGPDKKARKEYLKENVTDKQVGAESQSWRQGHRPLQRAGVLVVAVPVALCFGLLLITLLLGSITAMFGAMFLLVVGPVFAALWVIPGRPREWGVRWADALVGTVLQSAIVTLTAGAVMMLQMVTAMAMPTYGWLGSSALSLAGAVAAFKYRSILTSIVGTGAAGGGGSAGALLGVLATRSLARGAGRLLGAPRRISRRLGDAVERRHRPPATPPTAPGPPRPSAPPPPPPPAGRPPRPSAGPGPGRGSTGAGGTGPGATVAAAGRRASRTAAGAPSAAGPAPVHSPTARTIPAPATPAGQAPATSSTTRAASTSTPAGQAPASSPTARTMPAPATQRTPRRATQPPAPSSRARRTPMPRPRVARSPRRVPPPQGWTQPRLPDPPTPPRT
ncbi:hypothetical protein [Streptomyces sp. NBC_01264]|uniref:hypothetical protein n=1 Tax=Streptomyces sp. NBC_01264 TaxID=2903804 RepID=UPI0022524983|nr:hypothetical protein [Streptomyces sp. NBC_01264]MCX4784628.1 hypothetical protein [Streptomyces sp. NBC_01264]